MILVRLTHLSYFTADKADLLRARLKLIHQFGNGQVRMWPNFWLLLLAIIQIDKRGTVTALECSDGTWAFVHKHVAIMPRTCTTQDENALRTQGYEKGEGE